jgi:hypothetical protein
MKYAIEMGSGAMIVIPSFINRNLERIHSSSKFKCDIRQSSGEREKTFVRAGQPSTSH